ncbi:WD40 repeat domain-containing protein [Limnoglobus roseus]|uniref:WD40 repeat domain-containing protein n=1 Tax=Limnoglobus roseus TaxID=2598579 RepID=A0A5C1A7T1_9BACT|nr:WD40 repeat domain-containing protein [Limnoglobus roseus]QEL13164.1 WD40 repeat domain-containing protein [Limnoglobus roseus]
MAAVRFAADGTLYSVDESGILQHWSIDGRMLARHYLSDLETLWCFSPSGTVLISGNDDLLFWDVKTGVLRNRVGRSSWVTALAFSPNGGIAASGHDDGKVRFWDTDTHALRAEISAHPTPVSAIAFSPDGDHVATAGEDRTVRVWDRNTGAKVEEFLSHTDRIPALAWNAEGTLLISAGWDTSARVWKLGDRDPLMLLNSHADQVMALAASPTSSLLATADSDYEVHIWTDAITAKLGPVLRGHADEVRCLAFNADGSRLASAGADRVIHVWDTATGQLLAGPNPNAKHSLAVLTNNHGELKLASTGAQTFRLWDVKTGQELPPSGDGPAFCVAASRDGQWLAVGGTDHFTRLYDAANPTAPRKFEATKPPIGSLSFSPDGGTLAQTSPADGLLWLWNTLTGEPRLILIDAADNCTLESVVVHPDGQRIVVGGIDYLSTDNRTGAVCVWDLTTKLREMVFDVGVYAVAIDSPGRYVAGAGIDDTVHVWDLQSQESVFELAGHQERINCVAFNPDGSYLVSGGDDMTVRIWDVLSGRLLMVREFDSAVQSLAFSPDGRWLFTGNGNTTCYQLDFEKLLEE